MLGVRMNRLILESETRYYFTSSCMFPILYHNLDLEIHLAVADVVTVGPRLG